MDVSVKGEYALRAVFELCSRGSSEPTKIADIAARQRIPQKFLEYILLELKGMGLVDSKRGIFGGYFLVLSPVDITVGSIVRQIDGPLAPIRCASVTAYQKCDDCTDETRCEIRKTMIEVRNAIADVLDNKSIKELIGSGII